MTSAGGRRFAASAPWSYAWVILALACLATLLGGGVNNVSMSVVLRPFSEDRGWPRSVFAGAISTGTIVGGLLSPLVGRWADRGSARWLLAGGGVLLGLASLSITLVAEPWQVYLAYVPARIVAQTVLSVVPLVLAANWFVRGRSRALGAVSMAGPLGSAVLAPTYTALIAWSGWRAVFVAHGLLTLVSLVIPSAALVRARPDEVAPATDRPTHGPTSGAAQPTGLGAASAMRTPALWLITATLLFASLATGSVGLNLAAALTDQGLTPEVAAAATSTFALAGAVASLVWGVLAERVEPRRLLLGAQLVAAVAVITVPLARTGVLGVLLALVLGLMARGQQALGAILVAEYFGRRAFGTLTGLTLAAQTIALGLGPLLASASYDLTGSYDQAFRLLGAAYVTAAVLAALIRRPRATPTQA